MQEIAGAQLLDPTATELWFAGKRLAPSSELADRFGRNEKTKVVLRLVPAGQGAPPREQVRCLCDQSLSRTDLLACQDLHLLSWCLSAQRADNGSWAGSG